MRKNYLWKSLSLLLLLTVSVSCSSLSAIDKPVCVELSMAKGYCTTMITGKDMIVDDDHLLYGKTWFEKRQEMILVPWETWESLKLYLITNCHKSRSCRNSIKTWDRTIQEIDKTILDNK